MHIHIHLSERGPEISLEDPDDFRRFAVVVSGDDDPSQLAGALDQFGRREGDDHVFVRVDALKGLAQERARDDRWLAGLTEMVDYARAKGWTDAEGAVRAHVDRQA